MAKKPMKWEGSKEDRKMDAKGKKAMERKEDKKRGKKKK